MSNVKKPARRDRGGIDAMLPANGAADLGSLNEILKRNRAR
jgi:hypothetical protein